MWDVASYSCLITLGGHLNKLTSVDFQPGKNNKFVTASLDSSLKVWDFEAVAAGKVPPIAGQHYICLSVSPNLQYMASSQGWSSACEVESRVSQSIGFTATHAGSIKQIVFSPDSTKLVSLDTGHYFKGGHEVCDLISLVFSTSVIVWSLNGLVLNFFTLCLNVKLPGCKFTVQVFGFYLNREGPSIMQRSKSQPFQAVTTYRL